MKICHTSYHHLITLENIFTSYKEFRFGKKKNPDILHFERHLEDNLFSLHQALMQKTYRPGRYIGFHITDPKVRLIHKAPVQDRIVHHILSKGLERIFEPTFIAHSYSCRKGKGTHKGVNDLKRFARKVNRNNTRQCWALKCDVSKFFASVDHHILLRILARRIHDQDFLAILKYIIDSFCHQPQKGIPIGNLTSQYFANIYMNEFDQFVKHTLRVKHYLRYTDDFIFLHHQRRYLEELLPIIQEFLLTKLDLELHPHKVQLTRYENGIDFLGYIIFPHHTLPRTKTKRRMLKKITCRLKEYKQGRITPLTLEQTIQSYRGYLSHSNAFKLQAKIDHLITDQLSEE